MLNILTEPKLHVYLLRAALAEDIILKYCAHAFGLLSFLSEYAVPLSAFYFIKIQATISSFDQAWASSSHQMSLALLAEFSSSLAAL